MGCARHRIVNAVMPRIPIIALLAAALVAGIAAVEVRAEWLVFTFTAVPVALWPTGDGRVTSLRPLARTTLAFVILALLSVWSCEPDRRVMERAMAVVPHKGERIRTACVARIPGVPNRPVQARCRVRSLWVDLPIRLFEDDLPEGRSGTLFWFTGTLQQPASTRNPGEPDRIALARRSGIAAWASISRRDTVAVVDRLDPGHPGIRTVVVDRLDPILGPREAGDLVRAMITGDRSRLSNTTLDAFRQAGISHVLAVSGLHVSLVILIVLIPVSLLSSLFGLGWTGRVLLQLGAVLTLLWFVAGVVGLGPSVVRAGVFGTVVLVARLFDRSGSVALPALFLSVTIQICLEPPVLFDAGFLLSHAAVAGLIHVGRTTDWAGGLRSSLGATWFTSPIVSLYFGTVPLAGIAANLVAIPLTGLVVISGTLALVFDGLPFLVQPLARSAVWSAEVLIRSAALFADRLSFLSVPWSAVAIVLVSASLLALRLGRRGLLTSLILMTSTGLVVRSLPITDPLSMSVLDVGQGDATVLSTPDRKVIVVDTGPVGSAVVLNHLRMLGVHRIHFLFLTHLHADHTGGLERLKGAVVVDSLFVPEGVELPDSIRGIAEETRRLRDGETVSVGPELSLRVLAPSGQTIEDDPNASSLVLRIDHGDTSILLTGDAERESEETMVSRWDEWLDVDVVKVAHHGSRTSSAPFFVERTGPSFAVVSAGFNSYGLPSNLVIQRWEQRGAQVHLTRTDGAFCLLSNGRTFRTGC